VLAATTDKGRLPTPILERFELSPVLEDYTPEEGACIAIKLSEKVFVPTMTPMGKATALAVARAASNSPRTMRRILCAMRDLAIIDEIGVELDETNLGVYDLTEALAWCGLTEDGLTSDCQDYLHVLYSELRGQPAGAGMIAERLGLVGGGLAETERLLLDKGLVTKTKQGRLMTAAGVRRAREIGQAR
jgi:Holliday junction resolvasome RuvABC ATP-dependent DNA helicase subunit